MICIFIAISYRFIVKDLNFIKCKLLCLYHFLNHFIKKTTQSYAWRILIITLYIISWVSKNSWVINDLINFWMIYSCWSCNTRLCSSRFATMIVFLSRAINLIKMIHLILKILAVTIMFSMRFFSENCLISFIAIKYWFMIKISDD